MRARCYLPLIALAAALAGSPSDAAAQDAANPTPVAPASAGSNSSAPGAVTPNTGAPDVASSNTGAPEGASSNSSAPQGLPAIPQALLVAPRVDPGAVDTLVLLDGTVLRGYVSESRPGRSITLLLLAGGTREVPWAQIASARGPGLPRDVPRPPEPANAPGRDPLVPAVGAAPLLVRSTGAPLVVSMVTSPTVGPTVASLNDPSLRRELCWTPCVLHVRPGLAVIHTRGAGLAPHQADLNVPPDGLEVRVRASSPGLFLVGFSLAALGALPATAGPILLTVSLATANPSRGVNTTLLLIGGVQTAIGALLFIPGLLLARGNTPGIAHTGPLRRDTPPPRVSFGVLPIPGGGLATGGIVF